MIRIAINGFGRIGRSFLRTILLDPNALKTINIVALNIGPANPDCIAHMLTYDTLMGTFPQTVCYEQGFLIIGTARIKVIAELDPLNIDWKEFSVDLVVECTGKFTKKEEAEKHLKAGAKYVLISAPAKGEAVTIIPGVNEEMFNPKKDRIISLGSCTTNAFMPTLKVLHDAFTITGGFMTTVHAYTNSQVLLDVEKKDLRRSRAAALNIIPTTTGAGKLIGEIIPDLDGLVEAQALRVPVGKVSILNVVVQTKKKITADHVNNAFIDASKIQKYQIIEVTQKPLVSSDFSGNPYSVIIDGLMTQAIGTMANVYGWYDNEWGYSCRLKDFALMLAKLL